MVNDKILLTKRQKVIVDILISSVIILFVGFFLTGLLLELSVYFPEKLIYEFGNIISIIAGTAYLHLKYKLDLSLFGFDKINFRKIILWGSISGLTLALLNFPYTVISGKDMVPEKYLIDPQQGIHFVFLFLIVVVIIIPLMEELFFRGFVYRIVKSNFNIFWAYTASVCLFWAGHNFYVPTIISALIYCYVYEKTSLIGTSIIAHTIRNFIWYMAVYGKSIV
jgi:membrane protease YdiL (CAAX protease family)